MCVCVWCESLMWLLCEAYTKTNTQTPMQTPAVHTMHQRYPDKVFITFICFSARVPFLGANVIMCLEMRIYKPAVCPDLGVLLVVLFCRHSPLFSLLSCTIVVVSGVVAFPPCYSIPLLSPKSKSINYSSLFAFQSFLLHFLLSKEPISRWGFKPGLSPRGGNMWCTHRETK